MTSKSFTLKIEAFVNKTINGNLPYRPKKKIAMFPFWSHPVINEQNTTINLHLFVALCIIPASIRYYNNTEKKTIFRF